MGTPIRVRSLARLIVERVEAAGVVSTSSSREVVISQSRRPNNGSSSSGSSGSGSNPGGSGGKDQRGRGPRLNHMIRVSPIRVIGPDNSQVGIIETSEALKMAEEHGLDLVEVSPDAHPPVCKIMDYGKYKFDQAKKKRKARSVGKAQEMKEVRLGRSVKIDKHDVEIRVNQARKFLMAGHKVQVTQRFRGREIAHKDIGLERLNEVAEALADIARVESSPKLAGRQATMILAPDKAKIETLQKNGAA